MQRLIAESDKWHNTVTVFQPIVCNHLSQLSGRILPTTEDHTTDSVQMSVQDKPLQIEERKCLLEFRNLYETVNVWFKDIGGSRCSCQGLKGLNIDSG
jgi:uncharacterized protein YydD (DUF2326 family)